MKSLFLPMAIVGAVVLWYSNAQAADHGRSHGRQTGNHSQQQSQHHTQNRAQNRAQHHTQQYSQHHSQRNEGHGYGHRSGNSGRHEGYGHNESRGNQRSEHGSNRFQHNGRSQSGENRHAGYRQGVDQRQQNQRERIQQASRSGQLTGAERKSLWAEQRGIAAEERQYRSDGRLSRDERQDLQKDLTLASQHIYNESRDAERRGDNRQNGDASRESTRFENRH